MPEIKRKANAEWQGNLLEGKGRISTSSGAFVDKAYSFKTRFENEPGTNPEELIAAAHAACFSMAFGNFLSKKGLVPQSIATDATCIMTPKDGGGFRISKMRLEVKGRVQGLDAATFQQYAEEAEKSCPVSVVLHPGLDEVEVIAALV